MKIIFSGGGTLGSVTPLIAMYEEFKKNQDYTFLFVTTKSGQEVSVIKRTGVRVIEIHSGKLRRYFSFQNFFDIFRLFLGIIESVRIIWQERPDICITAGSFVSLPLHFVSWVFGIPTWVHQQDVQVGLANKLMSYMAVSVTTVLESSLSQFPKKKTSWLGNPVRDNIRLGNSREARKIFGISSNLPVIFVTGGGTGAYELNHLIAETVQNLDGVCEIVHLTGKGRSSLMIDRASQFFKNYHVYTFFYDEMRHAYALADIVISRGGFGTLSELATLSKCAIIIPKSGHQDNNVKYLKEEGAVLVMSEHMANGYHLSAIIKDLLEDDNRRVHMGNTLHTLIPTAKSAQLIKILKKTAMSD